MMSGQAKRNPDEPGWDFDDVILAELNEVETRREVADVENPVAPEGTASDRAANSHLVGISLSGGGIRSAAFSLGVLQGLQRSGWLRWIDYLSTVSGGGFAGAYLSSSVLGAGPAAAPASSQSAGSAASVIEQPSEGNPDSRSRRRNREEQSLAAALGDSNVQLPRIRQLLGSGGFLFHKVRWLNRQLIGMLLIWLVVLSGLVALSSFAAWLFRNLDYVAVRELLRGIGVRDDLTLAIFPAIVMLLAYLACWSLSYWKYTRVAQGGTARFVLIGFLVLLLVALGALIGNGEINLDGVSQLLTGQSLTPEWRRFIEQWLPTAIYSFLAASLIPYLSPRRLFHSGDEGASSLEQWTFNVTSAALVYGVPFLLVAFFARENISLYAQRRIPFVERGDLKWKDELTPPILHAIDADDPDAESRLANGGGPWRGLSAWIDGTIPFGRGAGGDSGAGDGRLRPDGSRSVPRRAASPGSYLIRNMAAEPHEIEPKLADRLREARNPSVARQLRLASKSSNTAMTTRPYGTADQVAEGNLFDDPQSEMLWIFRFRQFVELVLSLPTASENQEHYGYLKSIRSIQKSQDIEDLLAHGLNRSLIRTDFYEAFPDGFDKPKAWAGTAEQWSEFRRARNASISASRFADQWQRERLKRIRGSDFPAARSLWTLFTGSGDEAGWLFTLAPASHLTSTGNSRILTPQETSSVLRLRLLESIKRNDIGLRSKLDDVVPEVLANSNWNRIAAGTLQIRDLDSDDTDSGETPLSQKGVLDSQQGIKELLVTELAVLKRVVSANRVLLSSYYPETLEPSSTVFSYVVLNEDQRVRLNWFYWSAAIFLAAGFCVDLNATSWHGYYSRQIADAWIEPAPGLGRNIPLAQLETTPHGLPYHLISGTLNSFRADTENPRQTSLFLFSRLFCGADGTGYLPTDRFEGGKCRLADAIAVSGGAFSPFRERNPLRQCLLFLGNFRLGQWVQNAAFRASNLPAWEALASRWPVTPFSALLMMLRLPLWRQRYVFVTDGGHTDNLGLEPLLRRRCRVILAVDATEDPEYRFNELVKETFWMSNLYGIKFEWNPQVPCGGKAGRAAKAGAESREHGFAWQSAIPAAEGAAGKKLSTGGAVADRHWIAARITYPPVKRGQSPVTGYLVLIKPNVCRSDEPELIAYQRSHAKFPHDATSDLMFDANQFEAYRRLGEASARAVVNEVINDRDTRRRMLRDILGPSKSVATDKQPPIKRSGKATASQAAPSQSTKQDGSSEIDADLDLVCDSNQSWLARRNAARRLLQDPKRSEVACHRLIDSLGEIERRSVETTSRLLLEFGTAVFRVAHEILHAPNSNIIDPPLTRLVRLIGELLAEVACEEIVLDLLGSTQGSHKSQARRVLTSLLQSLDLSAYSADCREKVEQFLKQSPA